MHGAGSVIAGRHTARASRVRHNCSIILRRFAGERARRVPHHMHIVVADDLPAAAVQLLRDEGWSVDAATGRTPAELLPAMAEADALIVRSATRVTAALIAAAPKPSGDRPRRRRRRQHRPRRGERARHRGDERARRDQHQRRRADARTDALAGPPHARRRRLDEGRPLGEDDTSAAPNLAGKTLGVVGLGRIGRIVARLGRAFGMIVVAHDPAVTRRDVAGTGIVLDVARRAVRARRLHHASPAVHAETHHCSTRRAWRGAARGVRLVNTSRGELVDEAALLAALRIGPGRRRGARRVRAGTARWTGRWRSTRRWWRRRTSPPRRARRRNASASRPCAAIRDFLKDGRVTNPVRRPAAADR